MKKHLLLYNYSVKQNIPLGNGGGTLSNGEALILRAKQSITLEAGYEAVNGSELALLISDCMEEAAGFNYTDSTGLQYIPPDPSPSPDYKPVFFP